MARTMTARYKGRCRDCGGFVDVGDQVVFHGRGQGVSHADAEVCEANERDYEYRAESLAEQRMERWAEARFTGTTSVYWENEDYLRDHGMGGY